MIASESFRSIRRNPVFSLFADLHLIQTRNLFGTESVTIMLLIKAQGGRSVKSNVPNIVKSLSKEVTYLLIFTLAAKLLSFAYLYLDHGTSC